MKHILKTILRYRTSTILNIIGLSTAFTAFLLLAMQIRYDSSYNKGYKDSESIYMHSYTNYAWEEEVYYFKRSDKETFNKIAQLGSVGIVSSSWHKGYARTFIDVDTKSTFKGTLADCNNRFLDIFSVELISGNREDFNKPNSIIISDKLAKSLYDDLSPIGKLVTEKVNIYQIVGVFESLQKNSSIDCNIFYNIKNRKTDGNYDRYYIFSKLPSSINHNEIADKILVASSEKYGISLEEIKKEMTPKLIPFETLRETFYGYDSTTLYVIILIAFFILILAFINFLNFATSTIPLKVKGINLRRVVGATKSELIRSMMLTDLFLVIVSFGLSIFIVELVKDSQFNSLFTDTSFSENVWIYLITGVIAVIMSFITGIYPAIYSVSFSPSILLKGAYGIRAKGKIFRKALIGFQFFVTLCFVTISIFFALQHNYLVTRDGGYIREGVVEVTGDFFHNTKTIREELMRNMKIHDVTFSTRFGQDTLTNMSTSFPDKNGKKIEINHMACYYNFIDFFGIKMIEGSLGQKYENSKERILIVNKLMADKYQFKIGQKLPFHNMVIGGICDNVNLLNMLVRASPSAFCYYKGSGYSVIYIKVSGNSKEIFDHINSTLEELFPEESFDIAFLNDVLSKIYDDESSSKVMMFGFSAISIIIALVGVFGLVAFDTRFRRKEIGLRKVNGATVTNIVSMFSFSYLLIVFISFALSIPMVYYFTSQWLQRFPYRIEIYWWVFIIALVLVLILTMTISYIQTFRSARENPINIIKTN